MSVQQYKQVGYGLSQGLISLTQFPIVSQRAPTVNDKAQLGTVWVDVPADAAYVLVSIINNSATWTGIGGGTGDFTNILVSGQSVLEGGVLADNGIDLLTGNVTVEAGNVVVDTGNVIVTTGAVDAGGAIAGLGLVATGDLGNGVAAQTTFTNATNTTQGAGTLTIKSASANPGTNAGFLKIYVGTTTAFIPYYTNVAP